MEIEGHLQTNQTVSNTTQPTGECCETIWQCWWYIIFLLLFTAIVLTFIKVTGMFIRKKYWSWSFPTICSPSSAYSIKYYELKTIYQNPLLKITSFHTGLACFTACTLIFLILQGYLSFVKKSDEDMNEAFPVSIPIVTIGGFGFFFDQIWNFKIKIYFRLQNKHENRTETAWNRKPVFSEQLAQMT